MEKPTPEKARRFLKHVDKGGASRLGLIQSNGSANAELHRIKEAERVIAEDDAQKASK